MQQPSPRYDLSLFVKTLSGLFDEVSFAVAFLKGPELTIEFINQYNLQVWKGQLKDVLGKPLFEVRSDIKSSAKPIHEEVYRGEKQFKADEVPFSMIEDGVEHTRYFNVSIDPVRDEDGEIIGQLCTSFDVTEKVVSKIKNEEREQHWQTITDALPVFIAYVDKDLRYQSNNKKYTEILGNEGLDLKNKFVLDVLGDKAYKTIEPYIKQALRGNKISFQTELTYKNGETRHMLGSYIPHFGKDGNVLGVFAMVTDVTEKRKTEQEILYRKALLEAQNEAIPDAILMVDTKGKMISFNNHFIELWHIPAEIIDARDDDAALNFAMNQVVDPQGFIDRVNYCYAHTEEAAEEEILFKDGRIIERYGNAVNGEDNTRYGWIWYFRDITDQKNSEKALRDSEERYQNFISQSTEGIWRFEVNNPIPVHLPIAEQIELFFEDGYLAECNNAMAQMYGFKTATEMIGRRLKDFFPKDQDTVDYFTYFIGAGYRAENIESKEIDRQGQTKYFLNNFIGMVEEGKVVRAWGTQRDVTAQKDAENQLKESEAKFRTLTETLPELVWMTNEKGEQEYASSNWKEYSGIEPKDQASWEAMVHPSDLKDVSNAWKESLANGKFYSHEVRLKSKAGEFNWHYVQGEPIRNEQGEIIKWIGSCTNIQYQKNITQKLEKLVEKRTSELQRSNEDLQQFAHVASHDLKEPVRKILTFGNRLKDEISINLSEKGASYLSKIESSAIRMYSMIDGVLLYSSLNALEQTKEQIDLNEVIDNIESDLEVPITELNAEIIYKELPLITGSSILIYQLFYNLINNSLKFYELRYI